MYKRSIAATRVAWVACGALFAISASALVGWHAGLPALTAIPASAMPLRYNAALSFLLLAAALGNLLRNGTRAAAACSGSALIVGAFTLAQFVFGIDLGLDELLFRGYSQAPRMAPNAAFGIALGGAAILLASARSATQRTGALIAAAGAVVAGIGVTAAFGYFTGFPTTYAWAGLTPLSPFGALALCCLGVGLVATAWRSAGGVARVPDWLPLPLGVSVVTVAVVLWQAVVTVRFDQAAARSTDLARILPAAVFVVMCAFAAALSAAMSLFIRSERKQHALAATETAARRQQALLQNILDVLPVGLFVSDAHGQIVLSNRVGQQIWSGARYVGLDQYGEYKGWWAGTDRRLAPEEWALARAVRKGESVRDEVVDIEAFDGTRKTILNAAEPIVDGGQICGAVVAVQDITTRRQTELALAERTRELERSNADLEQFAYVASHDLQEPLRMVASFTQLLARRYEGKLGPDADEYIGFVVDGAHRMQRLLNGLLDYSRIGTRGRGLVPVSTGDVVREALANLRTAIEESEATIRVEDLPQAIGDHAQLVQVFQNLVSNALKFRDDGVAPVIRIWADESADECVFSVDDNGIGIEPRYADRIFTIFHRLDRSGKYPGTGLGLAICQRIVARHGGRIWVDSTPGPGARFRFTLRRSCTSAGDASPPLENIA